MDATNLKELNPPNHGKNGTTQHHEATTFPPITSRPIKKFSKYVFCSQLGDISTMEDNGNLCNLVNCSGTEQHTDVFVEKPTYRILPYDGN